MRRTLLLFCLAFMLIIIAGLFILVPDARVSAYSTHNIMSLETPTPAPVEVEKHAQDLLGVVNTFAALLAVVLTFLALVAGLLTFLGIRSYREAVTLAEEREKDLRAIAENAQKEIDKTREEVKKVREDADKTREALVYLSLGDRLMSQKNREEALQNYRNAERLLPDDSQMNYVLGKIYSGVGEYDSAIGAFEKSHPDEILHQANVQKELGLAYRRRGEHLKQDVDYEKAIQCLQKSIDLNPNDSDALAILGGLYRRKGKYTQAADCYERAWRLNPASSYALGNLASLSWYLGKVNEARTYFGYAEVAATGRIKKGQADLFWDYYDLALAQLATGKINEAKQTYTIAIKETPGNVQFDGVLNNLYLLQQSPHPMVGLNEIIKTIEVAKSH